MKMKEKHGIGRKRCNEIVYANKTWTLKKLLGKRVPLILNRTISFSSFPL